MDKTQDPVVLCESLYPETCNFFRLFQEEQYILFCKKNLDYGPNNIALGTQVRLPAEIIVSLIGIIIRSNDKIQRLMNLIVVNRKGPQNESVIDSFMDLSIYGTIALIVNAGKWGK